MRLESLEHRSLLTTLNLVVNLLQDNGGIPGAAILNDTVAVGQTFFVEILVQDSSSSPILGINGLALDINFDASAFEEVDSPFDPSISSSLLVTPSFNLQRGGVLNNLAGSINELAGGVLGNSIGSQGLEQFSLLRFRAIAAVTNSPFSIAIGSGGVGFVNGSVFDLSQSKIEAQAISAVLPAVSIDDVTVTEGTGIGTTDLTFTVTLSDQLSGPTIVQLQLQDGSAQAPADYQSNGVQLLTFPPHETQQKFTVSVVRDDIAENNETFQALLTKADGVLILDGAGLGTIIDDDSVTVRIDKTVTMAEGDSGSRPFDFTVSVDQPAEFDIVVPYTLANTTTTDADFSPGQAKTGKLTIREGDTSATISIGVQGETLSEPDESFTVTLLTPETSGANLSATDSVGEGVILDDDDPVIDLSLQMVSDVQRPNVGELVTFTLVLQNAASVGERYISPATDIEILSRLPAGLELVSSIVSDGFYEPDTGVWFVPDLNAGSLERTLELTARVLSAGLITHTVEIVAADQFDLDSTPNNRQLAPREDDTAAVTLDIPIADLSLQGSSSELELSLGDSTTWTLTLNNEGPDSATNVQISLNFPQGLAVTGSPSVGSFDPVRRIWTLRSLLPKGIATLPLTLSKQALGELVVTAQVQRVDQYDSDSFPGNVDGMPREDDEARLVIRDAPIDLEVTQTVDRTEVIVGEAVTIDVSVINRGPGRATHVVVLDSIPGGLRILSAVPSQGIYDPVTGIWTVGTLDAEQTATLHVVVETATLGEFRNAAQVISVDQFDVDSGPGGSGDNLAVVLIHSYTLPRIIVDPPPPTNPEPPSTPRPVLVVPPDRTSAADFRDLLVPGGSDGGVAPRSAPPHLNHPSYSLWKMPESPAEHALLAYSTDAGQPRILALDYGDPPNRYPKHVVPGRDNGNGENGDVIPPPETKDYRWLIASASALASLAFIAWRWRSWRTSTDPNSLAVVGEAHDLA